MIDPFKAAAARCEAAASIRAIIYTRFSPRPDAKSSSSCEVQEGLCRDFAHKKGYTVSQVINDPDISGADEFRPQLWAAVEMLKRGDILLVYKRDRLARNLYLAEMINHAVEKNGGRIEAVSGDVDGDGPEQQLIRQIVAAIAEYERKLISHRTSDALRQKQKQGLKISSIVPYGFKIDPNDPKRIIKDEDEQKVINLIMSLRAGGMAFNKIAKMLPADKARHGRWHCEVVRHIVNRVMHK